MGGMEVLVNCAGANSARGQVATMSEADLEAMMRLNCNAPLAFIKALHPFFAAAGSGFVVNILTTCCLFANEGLAAYTASKSAFEGIVKVYRKEARAAGIRVCAVYPGGIDTPFRSEAKPDYLRPEMVAEAIVNLVASPEGLCPDELVLRPLVERNFS
jgi:short-subunit dehydrogenase